MELIDDGTFDWSLGMDGWHHPDRIQANQYAAGINVSTRGGVLSPRPAFIQLKLVFDDVRIKLGIASERTIEDLWTSGKFQALIPYTEGSDEHLISIIGGLIFTTQVRNLKTHLVSDTLRVNQYASRINWSYAGSKIIIFDYPDYPLIIDGPDIKRADPLHKIFGALQPEVPISTLGTYNQNRLFIANAFNDFTAGDPVGSLLTPEAPLTFTEIFTPSSPFVNQQFSLPDGDTQHPITAMGFLQMLDTSTGIGPLFVATSKKLYAFKTDQPRLGWDQGQFGSVLLDNAGIVGPRAFVNVNSDLIFMSGEGKIHALSTARSDAKKWGNVPISREVQQFLKFSAFNLEQFTVLGYFDNRILISANPFRTKALDRNKRTVTDYAFGGFVTMDIESMASFLSQGTPTWDGLWTGVRPMEIQTLNKRCYVMSKEGGNRLYELDRSKTVDVVDGRKRMVRSRVYTKRYDFQKPAEQKREQTVLLHMQDIKGQLTLDIDRKPTHGFNWLRYGRWVYDAVSKSCEFPKPMFLNGFSPHQIKQLIFGDGVVQGCNPINGDEYSTFRAIQYRLTIEAEYWALELFKVRADLQKIEERQDEWRCEASPALGIPMECSDDWAIPKEALCL